MSDNDITIEDEPTPAEDTLTVREAIKLYSLKSETCAALNIALRAKDRSLIAKDRTIEAQARTIKALKNANLALITGWVGMTGMLVYAFFGR